MSKTALIVDDSPLARHVLSKLLSAYALTADTAPSAEEALEYLKQRRPDVIFMDHLMPGMDGFEALEAIKANPATATIPVMMYTSQEGELYVGQARALGAFGVLPKDLKPVEVARVLQALHLIPEAERERERGDRQVAATTATDATDSHRVKELLEELFYQQRSALREEIRESYQRALASTHTQLKSLAPPPPAPPAPEAGRPRYLDAAAIALALVAATFAYLYFNTNRLLEEREAQSSQLIASTARLSDASAQIIGARGVEPAAGRPALFGALEWAVNLAGGYAFDEVPLDDERARMVDRLVQYLDGTDFRGTVAIDVHVGRFCMNLADDGSPVLAPPEQLAAECAQIGWPPAEASAIGERQTLAFANAVATATSDTGILVETASSGSDDPVIEYPLLNNYLTAGEWNETAASNHRIEFHFLANDSAYISNSDPRP